MTAPDGRPSWPIQTGQRAAEQAEREHLERGEVVHLVANAATDEFELREGPRPKTKWR